MARFRVGFIGTGRRREHGGPQGWAMAYQHAAGYHALSEECELVACADIVAENAGAFAQQWGKGHDHVYKSAEAILEREDLDIVSIAVWPQWHAPLAIRAAQAGVAAIFCEKPMADTWGACRQMADVCREHGVRLAFDHQRRFGRPFRAAKEILESGLIGALVRVEFGAGNLYDYGTHNFDLSSYFAGERRALWAIAQIDYRTLRLAFGMHNENQAYALWEYEGGGFGLASTGRGARLVDCHNRLVGQEGEIEIGRTGADVLRYRRYDGRSWQVVDCQGDGLHGPGYVERAVADVVRCLREGRTSELEAENALRSTELIFACWESARRVGRVDLPLEIEDNPLEDMVGRGVIQPQQDAK